MLGTILAIVLTILTALVTYILWTFKYWKNRNVPHEAPTFPFGNIENPWARKNHLFAQLQTRYVKYKAQGERFFGFYFFIKSQVVLVDPELVKHIMAKDFQHFSDRGIYHDEEKDPLSAHLFTIGGAKWRNLRTKLTPTFTSGKMKMMLSTLIECSDHLEQGVVNSQKLNGAVDIKECLACFTTDVIGSVAFGLECNSFDGGESKFRYYGKKLFQPSKVRNMMQFLRQTMPKISAFFGTKMLPEDMNEFYLGVVKSTVEYREKNNCTRKDFLQILMDLKTKDALENGHAEHDGKQLTVEEIAAQAFVFFIAGFETSSTTMTFSLFELCVNPDIQDKCRREVKAVFEKYDGKLTYEGLADMTYLQQVIDEALRKYPPVPVLTRRCTKKYQIPGSDVILEKDKQVLIPAYALQHDPEFYPDPEKFDPERFNAANKPKINPYTYLPFGEGPRICIGLRFGIMQAKVGLTVLLNNFKFKLSSKTTLPLSIDPNIFILQTQNVLYLDSERI